MTVQLQHLERDLQGQLLICGQYGHRIRLTGFGQKALAATRPLAGLLGDLQRGAEEVIITHRAMAPTTVIRLVVRAQRRKPVA
jgi:hypothetical protein